MPETEEEVETDTEVETGPDSEAYEAKIAELASQLESSNAKVSELETMLTAAKAANYDLLVSVAGNTDDTLNGDTGVTDDDADVDVDDLFGDDE